VTRCSATTGCNGTVTAANSLVGATANDNVGNLGITALANGNYVVQSTAWDNPSPLVSNVGAVTWCSGATGCAGAISTANSIIGSTTSDGIGAAAALSNGNYTIYATGWDRTSPSPSVANARFALYGNGFSGTFGLPTDAANNDRTVIGEAVGGITAAPRFDPINNQMLVQRSVSNKVTVLRLNADVVGTEANYKLYRFTGAASSLIPSTPDAGMNRISTAGVTDFSDWAIGNAPLNNTAPTIAAAGVSRQEGSAATSSTIATVTDAESGAGGVEVNVASANPSNGVTISNLVNTNGTITADISTSCGATGASFTLQVSDGNQTADATLNVGVTADTPPTLAYNAATVIVGDSTVINPAAGPGDNGAIQSVALESQGTYTGTISVDGAGRVSVSNAAPLGTHAVKIRATDACGPSTEATLMLTVRPVANTCGAANSSVTYTDGAQSVNYTNLTGCGDTGATPISAPSAAALPFGYALEGLGLAWDVTTTATYSGPVVITFKLPNTIDAALFARLRVLHREDGVFVDRTILAPDAPAPNFATREISARVTSLSPFVIAAQNSLPLAASDQKAGSVRVFPYYTSDAAGNFSKSDTLITISNASNGAATAATGAPNYQYLHLFFLNSDCSPADTFVCLTPGGSLQIRASEYDPLTTGYLIAVAVDEQGRPTQNNSFIGAAFVRDDVNGVIDSYGAEAFWKLGPGALQAGAVGSAALLFDGVNYEGVGVQFAVQVQYPNQAEQTIVLASMSGVGALYRDDEALASFQPSLGGGGCFVARPVTNANFRVVPGPLTNFLKDRSGHLRFNVSTPAVGLLLVKQGAANQAQRRFAGVRALHRTAANSATLTLPVFPPFCN
jgi:hypothetical protein